jgi:predicted ATPase
LASAHAKLGRFEEAWRCITDALSASETTGEKWCDAEIYRIAGDIALMSPEADPARIDAYLDRALSVAREQRASSLELRAAISLARLWHGRGRRVWTPQTSLHVCSRGSQKGSIHLTWSRQMLC